MSQLLPLDDKYNGSSSNGRSSSITELGKASGDENAGDFNGGGGGGLEPSSLFTMLCTEPR